MAEASTESNEDVSEETEDLEPLEPDDSGTFQQVTNLLHIMDSESTETDAAGAGPDLRKMPASVIIREKATTEPSVVTDALIRCPQVPEISAQREVNVYSLLQEIVQQEGELGEHCVQRLVTIASKEMREMLQVGEPCRPPTQGLGLGGGLREGRGGQRHPGGPAPKPLSLVMYELQHRLRPLSLTEEFVVITLAKLANGNAMETFCETVQFYLRHLEGSVYPVMTEEQFAVKLFPMYCYFVTVWLRDDNPEVYDYIPLLLAEYQGRLEALFITQVLRQVLKMSVTTNTPVPQMQLHTIFTELHVQVCSKAPAQQQYSSQNLTEVVHCFIALGGTTKAVLPPAARSYPKELMKFFLSQMEKSKEALRVGTLTLISAVVSAHGERGQEAGRGMNIRTIHLAIRVVKDTHSGTRPKVRMAILRIIGQLALSSFQDRIKGWGLKYVSVQLTLSTYKLVSGPAMQMVEQLDSGNGFRSTEESVLLSVPGFEPACVYLHDARTQTHTAHRRESFYQRNLEEKMVHKVTMDTVRIITSSVSGMTNEFWVRLLCHIMETDHTEARPPSASVLMSSPYKGEGRGIAMLNLLRTLSQTIAPSMADTWELEIPLLVRYLEEHTEFTWNRETWKDKLIQVEVIPPAEAGFLRNSLKKTWGSNWSLPLSKELNNQIESFDSPSLEKKDHPWRRETVKGALMVMYSCVASYCHPQMLLTHVDNPITAKIIHHYSSSCQSPGAQTGAWGLRGSLTACSFPPLVMVWAQDICLKMAFMKSVVQVTDAGNIWNKGKHISQAASWVRPGQTPQILAARPPGAQLWGLGMEARASQTGVLSEQGSPSLATGRTALGVLGWTEGIPLQLGQFGTLVGLIAPCTCDSHRRTRLASVDVLSSLLDLHGRVIRTSLCRPGGGADTRGVGYGAVLEGTSQTCSSWGASKELELEKCKGDLQGSDMEKIFGASSRIAKVACLQFSCDEVVSLVQKLCENVAEILGAILVHLPVVDHPEVRRLLIEGILLLAHYHQETVLTSLLRQPLPMERWVPWVWGHPDCTRLATTDVSQKTGACPTLGWVKPSPCVSMGGAASGNLGPGASALQLHPIKLEFGSHGVLHVLSRFTPRADATSKADIWRLAAVDPLMTLCTIHLLTEKMDQDDKLLDLFPDLVYTLLLQLSSSQGPEAVSPVLKTWRLVHTGTLPEEINLQRCSRGITIKSMQLLFRKLNSEPLLRTLEEQGVWTLLESSSTFLQGASLLARWAPGSPELHVLDGRSGSWLNASLQGIAMLTCIPGLHGCPDPVAGEAAGAGGADAGEGRLRGRCRCVPGNQARADGSCAPQVRQYRKLLLEKCLCSLRGPVSPSVTAEGLEALAKVLAELREGDVGSDFRAISERCRAFFDHPQVLFGQLRLSEIVCPPLLQKSELLRLKAFVLFGKLAKVVRISKKHFFKEGVKKAWVPLMLHCQDRCSDAAQACVATMFHCVHFWGWKALESSSDQSDAIAPKDMTRFQITLCSVLELQLDSDPGVRRASLETLKILDTCSHHWLLASPGGIS
ncbi:hypothetical protein E2I00_006753 [Balaenoptera physalus]|uniref:Maestro heat-like repeat-containing protein family member 2A n=1 Tax=Balaenoptera physalus TaxID=9770 RepID=A0A643C9Q2_BALPH|nr:hypothetical protein E2I00_006753 [Balaenoptera physalus]